MTTDLLLINPGGRERIYQALGSDEAARAIKVAAPGTPVIMAGGDAALAQVEGLVWRRAGEIVLSPPAPLTRDLDSDMHGNVWDVLPMGRYRAPVEDIARTGLKRKLPEELDAAE